MRLLRPFSVRGSAGGRIFGLVARPSGAGPHPAVFLLPGALGSGLRMAASDGASRLVARGVAVVGFNAAGRGGGRPWDPRSTGRPDLNGPRDQDDLATIIRRIADKRWINSDALGICSVSYGLVAATGCLARHPDLPIRYLIDEEGPDDRHAAMLRPWCLATVDGPDWPARAEALFGTTTRDDRFWLDREPVRAIGSFQGAYLRLQAEFDHVQPPRSAGHRPLFHRPPDWWQNKHAITLVNAAVRGSAGWSRINLPEQGNPAGQEWSLSHPPRWIPGRIADHPLLWTEAILEQVQRLQVS